MGIIDRKLLWLALSGTGAANLSGADALLDGEAQGLAFDFTDQSVRIIDTSTPSNSTRSTGKVNQGALVGPGGKLTYTSPANKLVRQADGYYKYSAHNLYLNSAAPANQSITVVSGASYAVTITGTVSTTASGAATGTWTAGTNTFTAATTTLTLGSTSGSGTVHVYRTPAVTDYIETAGAAKYSLPYEYDTSGNCEGLLVEEQRTNLCLYSTQFDNAAWTPTASSVTPNNATGPDGLTSADLLYENTANAVHYIFPTANITVVSGTVYTVSVYAKQSTRYRIRVGYFDSTLSNGVRIDADLSAGTVGSAAADGTGSVTSSGIEDAGNGWYRVWVSGSQSTSTNGRVFISLLNDAGTLSYLGDGASGVHLWGAQLEAGSFPTSLVQTFSAQATRAADNISIATSAFPHSTTATTMYLKAIPFVDDGGDVLLEKAAPNRADAMTQIYPSGSGLLSINERGAAFATQAAASEAITYDGVTSVKAAVSAQTNLFDFSINGSTETQDTSGTHQATAHTTVNIGTGTQSQGAGRVIVQEVLLLPRISTAAELIARTS